MQLLWEIKWCLPEMFLLIFLVSQTTSSLVLAHLAIISLSITKECANGGMEHAGKI